MENISQGRFLLDDEGDAIVIGHGNHIMEIMQRLNEETGTAFIFATHAPRVVAFARRVVKMRDGRLVDDGSSNDIPLRKSIVLIEEKEV